MIKVVSLGNTMLSLFYLVPAFIFIYGLVLWLTSLKYRHLPGLGAPIIGNVYYSIKYFPMSITAALRGIRANHEKYGDTIAHHIGPLVVISTKDPNIMEELLHHPLMLKKDPLFYEVLGDMFEGAFSHIEADSNWKEYRKAVSTKMSRKHLELYHLVFSMRSKELIKKLATMKGEFDLLPWVGLMVADIVFECTCGIQLNALREEKLVYFVEFRSALDKVTNTLAYCGLIKYDLMNWKTLYALTKQVARDIIKGYKNSQNNGDFEPMLNRFIEMKMLTGLSVEEMMKPMAELLAEAADSASVCLSDAILHLAINAEFQKKAWEEQKNIFGDSLESPTYEDLNHMEYLDRVVKETIRLASPPATARRSTGHINAGGIVIPNNASVIFFWDGLRSNKRYWKYGSKFYPDHFLPEEVAKRPKGTNYMFSAGPRSCPGFQFTINCCKVALSNVIRNFKLSSPYKLEDLVFRPTAMMHLDMPHLISVEPRDEVDKKIM